MPSAGTTRREGSSLRKRTRLFREDPLGRDLFQKLLGQHSDDREEGLDHDAHAVKIAFLYVIP